MDFDPEICKFNFVAMISMIDPPRPGVPNAIEKCKSAGIRVIMITGDHELTASQIAKNIGIFTKNTITYNEIKNQNIEDNSGYEYSSIINGEDLDQMDQVDLDFILQKYYEIIFARTTPRQKLLIVESLQRIGYIVSVTGDGVNDTPALRKAHIGVAMGITGSDVAKNVKFYNKKASDIILIDDNFASIVLGIKEGRTIFDNLKKSIVYTLTSNIPEIVPFLLNVIFGVPVPVGTLTIICIDFTTDLIPAISLAYERPENNIMSRKPRDVKKDKLVGWVMIRFTYLLIGILQTLGALLSYFYITMEHGFYWDNLQVRSKWESKEVLYLTDYFGQEWSYAARNELLYRCHSAYFLSIVIIQWADLIISKTRIMSIFKHGLFNNKILVFSLVLETALSFGFVYIPYVNIFLKTRPVHFKYMLPSIIYAILLWVFDELRRWFVRKYPEGFIARETYY